MNKLVPHKIGDLLTIKHGFSFLGTHFCDRGNYIVLTPGNFIDSGGFQRIAGKEKYYVGEFSEEYLCKKGDLIVAMTQQTPGLLGSTAIVPEDNIYLHNQRIGLITTNALTDPMFIYYLFMSSWVRERIERTASGSKVKHTSPERIYDVTVYIPEDVEEQRHIAATLSILDSKITLNNRINAELERTAQTVYEYLFLQGEQSKVQYLAEKLTFHRGVEPGRNAYSEVATETETVPFIRVSDLGNTPTMYISEKDANNASCYSQDVMVAFDASVGKMAIGMEGAYSTGIRKIKAKDNDYSDALIYFIFKSEEIQHTIKKYAVGSNILHAASAIEHLTFPWNRAKIHLFNEQVEPMYNLMIKNMLQNKSLINLRNLLLPLLMNGQVMVAKRIMAEHQSLQR